MEFSIETYDGDDMEEPSQEFVRFAKKVETMKLKEEKPDVKPEKVFDGFKKKPKRKSERIKQQKK
jgi:5'-3' exonuclease